MAEIMGKSLSDTVEMSCTALDPVGDEKTSLGNLVPGNGMLNVPPTPTNRSGTDYVAVGGNSRSDRRPGSHATG